MKLNDLLRVSIRQVLRQRRRNIGMVLAIALGTAGFIVIITMGRDVKTNFNQDLELLGGATRIRVFFEGFFETARIERPQWFREASLEKIREIPGVAGVTKTAMKGGFAKSIMRDRLMFMRVVGVDEYFWSVNSFEPLAGTFFGREEVEGRRRICVVGDALAEKIFGRLDVVGELIPIDNDLYEVVGVLGGLGVGDRNQWAFLPITTAQDRLQDMEPPDTIYVRCLSWNDVQPVSDAIPEIVKANQSDQGLRVDVDWDRLKQVKKTSWWIELFIYVAISATLGLGGFGIWNTMMVAIRSRTREIGLKKAMGAEDGEILAQFLTEALTLSLGAAVFGVGLSRVAVEALAYLLHSRPDEPLFLRCVFLGLIFAALLGCAAGISPAVKASRMEVVSAIRHE
ncbi:MAG: ABC transporter permease [Pseudomonadota bacterium]